MSAEIAIQLSSRSWSSGPDSTAVVEIAPRPGATRSEGMFRSSITIGVNNAPQTLPVVPGHYTVRLFLPNGDIQAESVSVDEGAKQLVSFDMKDSPHEWLGSETAYGIVTKLPQLAHADALESVASKLGNADDEFVRNQYPSRSQDLPALDMDVWRRNTAQLVTHAAVDLRNAFASVERISGSALVPQITGWRWLSRIDPDRHFPVERLSDEALTRWWTGDVEPRPTPLRHQEHDERNARLVADPPLNSHALIAGEQRAFAAVKDPTGQGHYAVLPEGWVKTSRSSYGQRATTRVLMTVIVDAVAGSSEEGEPARWRCSTSVDDVEAMSLLGFLYSGQTNAADTLLKQAQELLFEKTENPVAAAVGAFVLLMHADETNSRQRPRWRDWIRNLYAWFPRLPDGAIAMAQMYLRHGDGTNPEEDIDVERLRGYALDAVKRGLPYLTIGIGSLAEVLMAIVQDDRSRERSGEIVERTRRAYELTQQLGRIVEPGEFFTVLRFRGRSK